MTYHNRLGILELERRQRAVETADPGVVALARQRYDEAQTAYDAGNYEGAIRLFTEAWTLVPHPAVLVAIGSTLWRLGRFQDALYRFQRYIRENPSGSELGRARTGIANVQAAMEREAAARSAPPPPVPAEVPAEALAVQRAAPPQTSQQVAQKAPSPREIPHPYEARGATYGVWIATGVSVLGLVGLGWWLVRRPKRGLAPTARR